MVFYFIKFIIFISFDHLFYVFCLSSLAHSTRTSLHYEESVVPIISFSLNWGFYQQLMRNESPGKEAYVVNRELWCLFLAVGARPLSFSLFGSFVM